MSTKRKTAEEKSYEATFRAGADFWTSEDGDLTALVIAPRADARAALCERFRVKAFGHPLASLPIIERFAYREWVGFEFYDGPNSKRRGKVWRYGETKTPYPVLVMELYPDESAK